METIEDKWFTVKHEELFMGETIVDFTHANGGSLKLWSLGHAKRIARGDAGAIIFPVTIIIGDPIDV